MKLLTKEIEEKFEKTPLYSLDEKGIDAMDAEVLVKYFNPCGAGTWFIVEASKQEDGDYLIYGYCHIFEWEWGYVMLSELENLKLPFGLTIERDLYSKGTVRELCGDGARAEEPDIANDEEER